MTANAIQIKRRIEGAAGAPDVSLMLGGELAINEVNRVLYYGLSAANDPTG